MNRTKNDEDVLERFLGKICLVELKDKRFTGRMVSITEKGETFWEDRSGNLFMHRRNTIISIVPMKER